MNEQNTREASAVAALRLAGEWVENLELGAPVADFSLPDLLYSLADDVEAGEIKLIAVGVLGRECDEPGCVAGCDTTDCPHRLPSAPVVPVSRIEAHGGGRVLK